ncbi:NTP transferase domain-containing protein [Roseovarius nanhaiticus]|uniref:phosphocholine cytidylyltransferase family protein n=1 Tax=Roseovarius nanhaiticus TaxID=573024 RepID=UPI00248FAAEE|nr:NTP transferase domain-containing protein [Roseovarius nanhaiticus]
MAYETTRAPTAVILAAGTRPPSLDLGGDVPVCLQDVGGSLVLERIIRNCLSCGISQFVIVLGSAGAAIRAFVDKTFRGIRVTYITADRYKDLSAAQALLRAAPAIGMSEFISLDADMVFEVKILRNLIDSDQPNALCVDRGAANGARARRVVVDEAMQIIDFGTAVKPAITVGVPIGIDKVSAKAGPAFFKSLAQIVEGPARPKSAPDAAHAALLESAGTLHALDVTGLDWTGVQTPEDAARASELFGTPVTTVSRGQQRALDESTAKARANV